MFVERIAYTLAFQSRLLTSGAKSDGGENIFSSAGRGAIEKGHRKSPTFESGPWEQIKLDT